ncbi:hypothetical protein V8E53_013919 [Lactarius tabidus]
MIITYTQPERLEDLAESIPDRVKILNEVRVTKLLKGQSGMVIGVKYAQNTKTCTALGPVILATSGYVAYLTSGSAGRALGPADNQWRALNWRRCKCIRPVS